MPTSVLTYSIAGNVRHQGLSVAGMTVVLHDLEREEDPSSFGLDDTVQRVKTGPKGDFKFTVHPGTYSLQVIPGRNTRFLRNTVPTLVVTGNTTCNINLVTGSILTIKPVTLFGTEIRHGEVVALGIEPTSYRTSTIAYDDEPYHLVMPKGKYHIGFRSPQYSGFLDDDFLEIFDDPRRSIPFISSTIGVFEFHGDDEMDLNLPNLIKFEGLVTDVFGSAIADARVTITPSGAATNQVITELGLHLNCITNSSGKFILFAEPGLYDINIQPDDSSVLFELIESNVQISGDNDTHKFQLSEGFRLRGQIVFDGSPLSRCLVRIHGVDNKTDTLVRSDENGFFSAGVPAGTYKVTVSAHPSYAPAVTHDGSEFTALAPWSRAVAVNGDTLLEVQLLRGIPLSGRMADDAGQSRPGVKISVFADSDLAESEVTPLSIASCMTDTDGNYAFFLAPGSYWLAVQNDRSNARRVEVGNMPIQFDLNWHGWCQLKFEVSGDSGQSVPRCRVSYSPYNLGGASDAKGAAARGYAVTDEVGVCVLTLPAGVYSMRFDPPPDSSYESRSIKQISISTDLTRPIKLPAKSSSVTTNGA